MLGVQDGLDLPTGNFLFLSQPPLHVDVMHHLLSHLTHADQIKYRPLLFNFFTAIDRVLNMFHVVSIIVAPISIVEVPEVLSLRHSSQHFVHHLNAIYAKYFSVLWDAVTDDFPAFLHA